MANLKINRLEPHTRHPKAYTHVQLILSQSKTHHILSSLAGPTETSKKLQLRKHTLSTFIDENTSNSLGQKTKTQTISFSKEKRKHHSDRNPSTNRPLASVYRTRRNFIENRRGSAAPSRTNQYHHQPTNHITTTVTTTKRPPARHHTPRSTQTTETDQLVCTLSNHLLFSLLPKKKKGTQRIPKLNPRVPSAGQTGYAVSP